MTDTASDARTFPFFQVENAVIDRYGAALGPYGLAVYMAIARHVNQKSGVAFPGMATIARETGMSRNRVVAAVKKLETTGLIRVNRRKRDDGGKASNEYTLVNATTLVPPQTPEPQTTTATDAPPCISEIHGDVSTEYIPCIPQIQEQDESNKTTLDNTNTKDSGASAPGAPAETPPALPGKDDAITDHTVMKNVLLATLKTAAADVTAWGEWERASKLLRRVKATRREVEGTALYCAKHFTIFGPMAVAKHLADFRAEQRKTYSNGMTYAEADRAAEEVTAAESAPDPKALAVFNAIKEGRYELVAA